MNKFLRSLRFLVIALATTSFGVEHNTPIPWEATFGSVTITGSIDSVDTIQLDTTFTNGTEEGRLQWDSEDGALEYGLPGGNVTLQVGLEQLMRVSNKTGATISNGVPVYVSGAQGSRPTVALADADDLNKHHVVGLATENIENNETGYVCTYGYVRDVDTSAWTAGDDLYLSIVAGELTKIIPPHPASTMHVGSVLFSNAESGIIAVAPTHEPEVSPYGALYIHDGSYTNNMTIADQYFQLENFVSGLSYRSTLTTSNITVLVEGIYDIKQFISFAGGPTGANKTYECAVHINGVHQNPGEFKRKLGAGGDVGSASSGGLFDLRAGDVIDLRMKCVGNTGDVIIEQASFFVERIH